MELTYKIVDKKESLNDCLIEKTGHIITFTLNDVSVNTTYLEKSKSELKGQIEIESAKMANIQSNHPEISDYTDEQLSMCHTYWEAKKMSAICTMKLEEVEKQLDADEKEVSEIRRQIS